MVKNKSILFITDSCPPSLTMSGIVMKNIIDALYDKNKTYIVAVKQGERDVNEYHEVIIRYIKTFPYYILRLYEKKQNTHGIIGSKLYGIIIFIFRAMSTSMRAISSIGANFFLIKKMRREVEMILKKEQIDIVLCNAKPFESFEAVLPLIRKYVNTKFIAYQTDDFVTAEDERYLPKILLKRRNSKRKYKINEYVNTFCNYCILESVYKKEIKYIRNKKKVEAVGIPLLIDHNEELTSIEREKIDSNGNEFISMVYTGSLVKLFRPPDDCLEIILEVAKEVHIFFDIYHRGDCGDDINQYVKRSKGIIRNYGTVDTEISYKAMMGADILVSISNYSGDQISGKTFDYISTGKPIIHFYYNKNDMNAEVLEKYGLAKNIMINKEEIKVKADEIKNFIKLVKGKKATYDEVRKQYGKYSRESVINVLFNEKTYK